ADENLLARARAAVVVVRMGRHLVFRAAIVVLVDDVRLARADPGGRDDLELRILLPDGVEELRKAALVAPLLAVELVLVAHLDVFELERRGMPVLGATRAPGRVRVARDVL